MSAEVTPPALLAWAGDRTLAVTRAGPHFLEVFQVDDTCSLVGPVNPDACQHRKSTWPGLEDIPSSLQPCQVSPGCVIRDVAAGHADTAEGLLQVRVAVHGASGCSHSSPAVQEKGEEGAPANELDEGGGVPLGLRVLPLPEGLHTGLAKHNGDKGGRETEDAGSSAAAVKGLAVYEEASGVCLMALTYSRDCQLQAHVLGRGNQG